MSVSAPEGVSTLSDQVASNQTFITDVPNGILVGDFTPAGRAPAAAQQPNSSTATLTDAKYTDEDLARARAQEKDKLYPELERMKEELATIKRRDDELEAERQRVLAEEAEAARLRAEEDMSARELLELQRAEFAAQLDAERSEREKAFALLDQERQFQEINAYRQQRIADESENIIPELLDLVTGSSPDEIELSIAGLRDRSSRILDSAQQAMQAARRDMAGARVTAPAAGPLDTNSDNQSFSAEQIAGMSFNDYVKNRTKLLGQAGGARNSGLFG